MMKYAEHWGASINWVPVDENKSYNLEEIEKRISAKTKFYHKKYLIGIYMIWFTLLIK